MDCENARQLLPFAGRLPPELDESDSAALAGHLADCPTCGAQQREERRADDVLGRSIRAVPLPDGLRDRIAAKLSAQRERRYLRRVLVGAATAVAASVLLLAGITYFGQKPAVNLNERYAKENSLPTSPDEVRAWFQRPALQVPTQFDYRGLLTCEWTSFQGKIVPCLLFRQGTELAWVYILNDRQFDLKSLDGQEPLTGGRSLAVLRPTSGDPHFAFIVVYTGGSLETFLSHPAQPL